MPYCRWAGFAGENFRTLAVGRAGMRRWCLEEAGTRIHLTSNRDPKEWPALIDPGPVGGGTPGQLSLRTGLGGRVLPYPPAAWQGPVMTPTCSIHTGAPCCLFTFPQRIRPLIDPRAQGPPGAALYPRRSLPGPRWSQAFGSGGPFSVASDRVDGPPPTYN